jgi:hypothetical protein
LILLDKNYKNSIGTLADLQSCYFHTNSISTDKTVSSIDVKIEDIDGWHIPISIVLKRKANRAIKFAIFSMLSLVGITIGAKVFDFYKCQQTIGLGIILTIIAMMLVGTSTYSLYKFFNKSYRTNKEAPHNDFKRFFVV